MHVLHRHLHDFGPHACIHKNELVEALCMRCSCTMTTLLSLQAEVFVIRLLQRNAKVATAGADRNTPLHLAAMKGFTNVAKKLIDNGAYVAAENKAGHNPLYLAVENNHCDFAVLMVHNMEPTRYMYAYLILIQASRQSSNKYT